MILATSACSIGSNGRTCLLDWKQRYRKVVRIILKDQPLPSGRIQSTQQHDPGLRRPRKTRAVRAMNRIPIFVISLIMSAAISQAVGQAKPPGPTSESALAADKELAHAIRDNDPGAILRMLDNSWAVISTSGGVGEGPSIFPDGIKSGDLTRKTFAIAEPRVRLYGDVALVTTRVSTSGTFQSKPFDVTERQTDVWLWKGGMWKCILTHETKIRDN